MDKKVLESGIGSRFYMRIEINEHNAYPVQWLRNWAKQMGYSFTETTLDNGYQSIFIEEVKT